jgi:hypothetical protein
MVRAVDDAGRAVPGADIGFSWGLLDGPKPNSDRQRQIGDQKGQALFSGKTIFARYGYGARKDGYYPVHGMLAQHQRQVNGRWEPWEPTLTVTLKPIKNPIAMFARTVTGELPRAEGEIGFDLEKGDWVAPHGKGARADLAFSSTTHVATELNYDGTLTVRLPGDGNGILAYDIPPDDESVLKLPYTAPAAGYQSSWTWRNGRATPAQPHATSTFVDESAPRRGFIFRVRSETNAGHVTKAWYGKIHGPFVFDARSRNGRGYVSFTYYLNPSGTPNLEFDPRQNLFSDQQIRDP